MLAFLFVGILFMPCYNENFQTKMSLCQASVCVSFLLWLSDQWSLVYWQGKSYWCLIDSISSWWIFDKLAEYWPKDFSLESSLERLKFKRLNIQKGWDGRKLLKTVYSGRRIWKIQRPFCELFFLTLKIHIGLFQFQKYTC